MHAREAEVPRELHELAARIARLKDRLRCGDPDMTADELQADERPSGGGRHVQRTFTHQWNSGRKRAICASIGIPCLQCRDGCGAHIHQSCY
jgi:hypothetical protein